VLAHDPVDPVLAGKPMAGRHGIQIALVAKASIENHDLIAAMMKRHATIEG
jgi:hypothetical protein